MPKEPKSKNAYFANISAEATQSQAQSNTENDKDLILWLDSNKEQIIKDAKVEDKDKDDKED